MLAKCEPENEEAHFLCALAEKQSRESFLALAEYYRQQERWEESLALGMKALEYTEKDTSFMSEEWAWGHTAYDLVAVVAWQLGSFETALEHIEREEQQRYSESHVQNLEQH